MFLLLPPPQPGPGVQQGFGSGHLCLLGGSPVGLEPCLQAGLGGREAAMPPPTGLPGQATGHLLTGRGPGLAVCWEVWLDPFH